jgi:hypothetical protein
VVDLFTYLDVDHPSVADEHGEATESVLLQAREHLEKQLRFSIADARRQARHRARPIQQSSPGAEMRARENQIPIWKEPASPPYERFAAELPVAAGSLGAT